MGLQIMQPHFYSASVSVALEKLRPRSNQQPAQREYVTAIPQLYLIID